MEYCFIINQEPILVILLLSLKFVKAGEVFMADQFYL